LTQKRHPYLLPYEKVDSSIKKANRENSLDTIKTLLAYGYILEPPIEDVDENARKKASGKIFILLILIIFQKISN
jgi:hypothetical protein